MADGSLRGLKLLTVLVFDSCLSELWDPHSAVEPEGPGLPMPDSFQPEKTT